MSEETKVVFMRVSHVDNIPVLEEIVKTVAEEERAKRETKTANAPQPQYKLKTIRHADKSNTLTIVENAYQDPVADPSNQYGSAITTEFCKYGLAPYLEGELHIKIGQGLRGERYDEWAPELSVTSIEKLREPEGELNELSPMPYLNPCYTPRFLDTDGP
ncbi:MAG: hypothetical protein Q9160_003766 [Pyrenula sp. 1 TL-2023]